VTPKPPAPSSQKSVRLPHRHYEPDEGVGQREGGRARGELRARCNKLLLSGIVLLEYFDPRMRGAS